MGMRMHQYLKGEGGFLLCRAYKKKQMALEIIAMILGKKLFLQAVQSQ
jgi:hypothetical protein